MTGYSRSRIEIQPITYMKLLLTALCASFMVLPAFASECEKGKCDKEKKEEGALAHCGKCGTDKEHDKDKDKEKKEEKKDDGALLASDCEKGKCDKDKEKKEEGALLASECEKGKCDKEKCDKDKKEEGAFA